MRLTLSSETVRNAVMRNESGQILYRTFHPLKLGINQGTTTIQKIKPNDDPTDMRDQFDVLAQIEWHLTTPTVFRMHGQELPSNVFIPRHGIRGRLSKRTFTGQDGRPYRWDMHRHVVVLSRNDETREELARYHRATLGILGPKQRPYLEIHPDVWHMLDMIVVTFVYIEKLHMDKDRGAQRNSGTRVIP
ncbi:hypothetical protein OG21DRAFT_1473039 [Imleria badia]|nr:hypothetical protein OG21DRAFT_1473039 [Imleria badia]